MKLSHALRAAVLALVAFAGAAHATEIRQISQIVDTNGKPVVNGYIYVGTYNLDPVSNPISLFSDSALTTPIANPQRTDSYGRPVNDIYFSATQYSYTLKNSAGTTIEGPKNRQALPTAASVTQLQSGTSTWAGTATGTANAITLSLSPALTSYADGLSVRFRVAITNTLSATVSINGVGAKNLTKEGGASLVAGDLTANQVVQIVYNSTQNRFELVSADHALSRTGGAVTGATTVSGVATFTGVPVFSGVAVNTAQGADVAAAATLNLDTMTGNEGQLTGITTVTAVTLTNGRQRTLRATAATPFTAGASLVINTVASGSTYTCAVGDILIFNAIQGVVYLTVVKSNASSGSLANYFESSEITVTGSGQAVSVAHNLGQIPKLTKVVLRCKTAEFGYAIGDEVPVSMYLDDAGAGGLLERGAGVVANATNLILVQGNSGMVIYQRTATIGDAVAITPANWRFVLRAWI